MYMHGSCGLGLRLNQATGRAMFVHWFSIKSRSDRADERNKTIGFEATNSQFLVWPSHIHSYTQPAGFADYLRPPELPMPCRSLSSMASNSFWACSFAYAFSCSAAVYVYSPVVCRLPDGPFCCCRGFHTAPSSDFACCLILSQAEPPPVDWGEPGVGRSF